MKKTIFLSIAMAFVTFTAFAQEKVEAAKPHATVEDRAKRQVDRINNTAQLSTDQYAKVLEITKNFIGQKDALRASGAQGDDMSAKFRALGEQEKEQLKKVLTPAQLEKVEAARNEQREKHKGE